MTQSTLKRTWTPELRRARRELYREYHLLDFTKGQLSILITTLNQLITLALTNQVPGPVSGICYNWADLLEDAGFHKPDISYDLVLCLAIDWPESRGFADHEKRSFPIEADYDLGHWEGSNRDARVRLMRYMAHRLRDWRRRA